MGKNIHIFDVDGVLADSWQVVLTEIRRELGVRFDYEQLDHFAAIYDLVRAALDETAAVWAENLWFDNQVLRSAPLAVGAKETLKVLIAEGNRCFACTSRLAKNTNATLEWFEEYLPFFPRENVLIRVVDEEADVSGDEFKQICAYRVEANHQYDDMPAPLRLTRSGADYLMYSFLVNRPWNEQESLDADILRIQSLSQTLEG